MSAKNETPGTSTIAEGTRKERHWRERETARHTTRFTPLALFKCYRPSFRTHFAIRIAACAALFMYTWAGLIITKRNVYSHS